MWQTDGQAYCHGIVRVNRYATRRQWRSEGGGGGGTPRAALARGGKRVKNCLKNCTHANSDGINLFVYEEQKILLLTCRAQHHTRGGNSTTLSFKGIAGTYPRQITAIMCHVKFDKYKKLGGRIYATPCCVAENVAKLLKIMRNYTAEKGEGNKIHISISF